MSEITFERKMELLTEKKKQMNNGESFQQIFKLWNEINAIHGECKKEIQTIKSQLECIETPRDIDLTTLEKSFDFDIAFQEIQKISEEVKTCSVSLFPEKIARLHTLKELCCQYLEREKAKLEEVK